MQNLILYYIAILIPLAGLFSLHKLELISPTVFLVLFLFYFIVYRTYTDGYRLRKKNLIRKKEMWKLVLPGRRLKYLRELYLK